MTPTDAPARRYRIAEVAELTGFTPSALRYYEDTGVLPPPARSPSGYRTYDERDVARLRLVARAKDLGCTLEEIAALVQVREADECAPVKHRLRSLVEEKRAEVQRLIADQSAFAAQLRATADALASRPLDGPCSDACGCTTQAAHAGVPVACSLAGDAVEVRLAEWREVLASVSDRERMPNGIRLLLDPSAPLARIAELAVAEHACCPFLDFTLTIDGRGTALEVSAPGDGRELVDALVGGAP